MKYIKITIVLFGTLLASSAIANNLIPPVINLGGVSLIHSLKHPTKAIISLAPLTNFTPDGEWNISCDFKIKETGGAQNPSATNPLAATIDIQNSISSDGYTQKGFIAPSGTFELIRVCPTYFPYSIPFSNYDTTGDLFISNCKATLQLSSGKV